MVHKHVLMIISFYFSYSVLDEHKTHVYTYKAHGNTIIKSFIQ